MGGDANGDSDWMDYAELRESDNSARGAELEHSGRQLDDSRLLGSEVNEQQAAGVEQPSELVNAQHYGLTATEISNGISSESKEGGMPKLEG